MALLCVFAKASYPDLILDGYAADLNPWNDLGLFTFALTL
jgi:hypothetical protein